MIRVNRELSKACQLGFRGAPITLEMRGERRQGRSEQPSSFQFSPTPSALTFIKPRYCILG